MTKCSARAILVLSAVIMFSTLGCGGENRQLQSITADSTGMTQFQFTATGTFSTSPTNVTPLPVSWFVIPAAYDPGGNVSYSLTVQPFATSCQTGASVVGIAPASPSAPSSGTIPAQVFNDLVSGRTPKEDGFVASSPVFISCP